MAGARTPIIEAGWLAALALTPVVVDPWSDPEGDPSKAVILRLLVLLMLGGWLAAPAGAPSARARALGTIVACWLAAHVLSTLTAISPAVSLLGDDGRGQELVTIAAYAVLLVLVGVGLTGRVRRERAVSVILVTSTSVAIYALVQRLGLDGTASAPSRPGATLGGPIFLGAYLGMTAPLALARLLENVRRERRVAAIAVHAVVFGLQSAALLSTMSRGPFLGFMAALLTLALLDARMGGARRAAAWIAPCAMAILVTVAAGRDFSRLVHPGGDTTRSRVLIWEATMRLAGPHEPLWSPVGGDDRLNALRPLVGYGPESLYAALGPFRPDELGRLEPWAKPDRAHNALLDALATTGALGALAYLALLTGVLATGLGRLGVIPPGGVPRFVAWCATSSVATALVAASVLGVAWIAPAVGWGLAGGSLAFVAFGGRSRAADDLMAAALLAGVVGHVVETQVGIATTSSWVHFSFFAGALVAGTDADVSDGADRIALHGVMAGLILCALVFQLVGSDDVWSPGAVVLLGGTTLAAVLLVSAEERASLRDLGWLAALALALPAAFALPAHLLVRRVAAGHAETSAFVVLLFVAFVGIAVLLAARALRGEQARSVARPRRLFIVASTVLVLVAGIEIARLHGNVLGWAATRSSYPVEQRLLLLERARRLQPLAPRADALLGGAYLSLAERGLPHHALARAEKAFARAQRMDPFDADYALDLARLDRAAARLVPAQVLDRLATAIARYEAAARLDPAARQVHFELAATLADQARLLERAHDPRAAADARERAQVARDRVRALQPTWAYSEPID